MHIYIRIYIDRQGERERERERERGREKPMRFIFAYTEVCLVNARRQSCKRSSRRQVNGAFVTLSLSLSLCVGAANFRGSRQLSGNDDDDDWLLM